MRADEGDILVDASTFGAPVLFQLVVQAVGRHDKADEGGTG